MNDNRDKINAINAKFDAQQGRKSKTYRSNPLVQSVRSVTQSITSTAKANSQAKAARRAEAEAAGPICIQCQTAMTKIKREAKYGCLGQGIGLLLIFWTGTWAFWPMVIATAATISMWPIAIFLIVIILSISALNGKKKIRVCPSCGYSFEIKK